MIDLTDERIAELVKRQGCARLIDDRATHTALIELQRRRVTDRDAEFVALRKALHVRLDEVQKQAERIRQLEAAQAADEERVRSVVKEACLAVERTAVTAVRIEKLDAIIDRAAKQLASAAVRLTDEDVDTIRHIRLELIDANCRFIPALPFLDRLLATVSP